MKNPQGVVEVGGKPPRFEGAWQICFLRLEKVSHGEWLEHLAIYNLSSVVSRMGAY